MIAFALVGLALSPRVHRHAAADALDAEADEQMSLTDFDHKFKVDGRFRTVRSRSRPKLIPASCKRNPGSLRNTGRL